MPNLFKSRFVSALKRSRYLVGLFIAVELLALPAAAQIVHSVSFKVEPHVVAAEIPLEMPGRRDFLVSSNAPFNIAATGMIGEIDVTVNLSGQMGELTYGQAAQMPGPEVSCAALISPNETQIYEAKVRTAAKRGTPVEQAVIISITYDPIATPDFTFTVDEVASVAGDCGPKRLS